MAKIVLLPNWEEAPSWNELVGKVFAPDKPLPGPWQPHLEEAQEVAKVEAFAFPTPFAWAEMMAAVVRSDLYTHLLFKLYENLVLGLVLGQLQLAIVDLKQESGEFGKVLAQTDEGFRYFGLLRGSRKNKNLLDRVFGATSPDSLFWPSPRPSASEWTELRKAINEDSHLKDCYQTLADFRGLLKKQRLWDSALPWVKGLDHIIGDRQPRKDCMHFHVRSRLVGPILSSFPKGEQKPLYFPIYEEKFSAELLQALTGSFKQEGDKIAIYDDRDTRQLEIMMPSVPPGGSLMLAGAGIVKVVDAPGKIKSYGSNRVRLHDDEKGKGLFSLLQPLYMALGNDLQDIKDRPYFYPDVVRIPVTRLGEAGVPNTDVSFSDRAYELALEPESPGLPLAAEIENPTHEGNRGFVLPYPHQGRTKRVIYLEEYAGYNIGDLKALGWVLWSFFTGSAKYDDGEIQDTKGESLLGASSGRPFDPTPEVYPKVDKEQEKERHKKLASLQRFIRAYFKGKEINDATDTDKLCYEAAKAFARWVWGEDVVPNGRPPRTWQTVQLGTLKFNIAKDGAR